MGFTHAKPFIRNSYRLSVVSCRWRLQSYVNFNKNSTKIVARNEMERGFKKGMLKSKPTLFNRKE